MPARNTMNGVGDIYSSTLSVFGVGQLGEATDAEFALHRIPGLPRSASSGYASAVLRRTIAKRKGRKALCVSSSQRGKVLILKPAWPKSEAHRAEAKFWVWFFFVGERERIARLAS